MRSESTHHQAPLPLSPSNSSPLPRPQSERTQSERAQSKRPQAKRTAAKRAPSRRAASRCSQATAEAFLKRAWRAGVQSVLGRAATSQALARAPTRDFDAVLAVGKAAQSMCQGALDVIGSACRGVVVTPYGSINTLLGDNIEVHQASHPLPDKNSLRAGARVRDFVAALPADSRLLMLVSGGASALVEVLVDSVTLAEAQRLNRKMLAEGWNIQQINWLRAQLSTIKGGKLLQHFRGAQATILGISDVLGDRIDIIGSGIGCPYVVHPTVALPPDWHKQLDAILPPRVEALRAAAKHPDTTLAAPNSKAEVQIIASNRRARHAVARYAARHGLRVIENAESLHQGLDAAAAHIVQTLQRGAPGVYIWGGEPTVVLPPHPGQGGRNQSLALAIALGLRAQRGISVLVAGTDGVDGCTKAAGGLVNAATVTNINAAQAALAAADAHTFLQSTGDVFYAGQTGTNVMDLVVACKRV